MYIRTIIPNCTPTALSIHGYDKPALRISEENMVTFFKDNKTVSDRE